MDILSWNILSGGFKDYGSPEIRPGRIGQIARAVRSVDADVVSLVDTYRWTEVFGLEELKELFGYNYALAVKLNDERLVGLGHDNGVTAFSKLPETRMEVFRMVTRNVIRSRIGGIDIFSTYLDDKSEDTRLKQIEQVLGVVNHEEPTIIAGDLNTFDKGDLSSVKKVIAQMAQKFPGRIKAMEPSFQEMMRGEVTARLKQAGFADIGAKKGNTVPAKLFPLPINTAVARFDYAFANSRVKATDFKVLTGEPFASLSDHYPIWMRVEVE